MKCYHYNLPDKSERFGEELGERVDEAARGEALRHEDPFLLIYHLNTDLNTASEERARKVLEDRRLFSLLIENGGYVLFLKGAQYGGLGSREKALPIQKKYDHRVHFLSYSVVDRSDIVPISDRWDEFFRRVEEEDQVDWDLIDSDWPENLVALYMLACAVENGDSPSQEKLQERFEWGGEAQDEWESIIKQASREYKMHSGQEKELDPRTNDSKDVIASCLRETSPHVSK